MPLNGFMITSMITGTITVMITEVGCGETEPSAQACSSGFSQKYVSGS
jgi:hypothetical protein